MTEPTPRVCPTCSSAVEAWARFCRNCGSELPDTPEGLPGTASVPWSGWEALLVIILGLAASAVVGFALIVTMSFNSAIAASVVAGEIATLSILLLWVRNRYGGGLEMLGLRGGPVRGHVGAGVLAGLLGIALQVPASIVVLWLARLILGHEVTINQLGFKGTPSAGQWTLVIVGAVILAPVAEELLFRGFYFQAVRKWAGPVGAAALSGLVFALAHLSPLLYLPIGILGYVLARLFERRGSIVATIAGHATFNLFGVIVLLTRS